MSKMKLASVVVAMLLFFAAVSGTGYALADNSLPGEPLYGLKGTFEQARVNLTRDPEAKAKLAIDLAQQRMEEIMTMLQSRQGVDVEVARQAREQLTTAEQAMNRLNGTEKEAILAQYQHMHQWAFQRMGSLLEDHPPEEAGAVPQLLQFMSRTAAQYQYQAGQEAADPSGTQTQTQQGPGGPPDAMDMPEPGSQLNALEPLGPYGPWGAEDEEGDIGQYGPGQDDTLTPPYKPGPAGDETVDNPTFGPGPGQPSGDAPLGPNQPDPSGPGTGDQTGDGAQIGDGVNGQNQNGTGPGTGGVNSSGQDGGGSDGGTSGGNDGGSGGGH